MEDKDSMDGRARKQQEVRFCVLLNTRTSAHVLAFQSGQGLRSSECNPASKIIVGINISSFFFFRVAIWIPA